MFKSLFSGIDSIFSRDPAARSRIEVLFCYPGVHAMAVYRLSHWLWTHHVKFPARFLSYLARIITGIEIHPGASIGRRLFIDHGFGVVIGETAVIGDDVTLYHDVTLGGTSLVKGRRHPSVGNNVIVGAGAQILGPIEVGAGARVGSNAVVIADVPAGATVVGVPAREVDEKLAISDEKSKVFEPYGTHDTRADPTLSVLQQMADIIQGLKARVEELESRQAGIEKTAGKWEG